MISPFYWILALLIIGLIVKNRKTRKRLFISSAVVFVVFSSPLIFNLFARQWNYPPQSTADKQTYSCAILLGGFASEDANGNGYFNPACDRFIEAIRLKNTGKVGNILMTGGNASLNPDGFREGDWVKTQFKQLNIPDTNVLIESNSRNTFENAAFSKKLIESKGLKPPYLLVTGAFHMRRALYIFKKAGLTVIPYPTEYNDVYGHFSVEELVPNVVILASWNTYVKEIVGYIVARFK